MYVDGASCEERQAGPEIHAWSLRQECGSDDCVGCIGILVKDSVMVYDRDSMSWRDT